jgi:5-methylthioadenosine/S-adenosylhomocysteine deaminase
MADLVIAHAYVASMAPDRHVVPDGAIAIEGSRIVAVGPTDRILAEHRALRVIDATDMLAVPGLIDVHFHPNQYLSNGVGDDVDIHTWLFDRVYPYESVITPEEAYWSGWALSRKPFVTARRASTIRAGFIPTRRPKRP